MLEVSHVNPELLANIMQQNLIQSRFKDSIARKPRTTLDELLVRAEKYIRKNRQTPLCDPHKRKGDEENKPNPHKLEGSRTKPKLSSQFEKYTPLKVPQGEILAIAEQQGIVRWPLDARQPQMNEVRKVL